MLAHELRNPAGADPQRRRDPPDARHPRRRTSTGPTTSSPARSSTWSAWSTTCSTSRGSPAARSSSARSRSTSPSAVARAVETSRPLIDARRHELTVTLPAAAGLRSTPTWSGSPRCSSNLLNNAAKYTEEGGRIELEVTQVGDEVVFRVRDNGIGISPEMLSTHLRPVHPGRPLARPLAGGPGRRPDPGPTAGRDARRQRPGPQRGAEPRQRVRRPPAGTERVAGSGHGDSHENRAPAPSPRRILMVDDYSANA